VADGDGLSVGWALDEGPADVPGEAGDGALDGDGDAGPVAGPMPIKKSATSTTVRAPPPKSSAMIGASQGSRPDRGGLDVDHPP
jgi:hypothetical protein